MKMTLIEMANTLIEAVPNCGYSEIKIDKQDLRKWSNRKCGTKFIKRLSDKIAKLMFDNTVNLMYAYDTDESYIMQSKDPDAIFDKMLTPNFVDEERTIDGLKYNIKHYHNVTTTAAKEALDKDLYSKNLGHYYVALGTTMTNHNVNTIRAIQDYSGDIEQEMQKQHIAAQDAYHMVHNIKHVWFQT